MLETDTSGLMSGEGKRVGRPRLGTAPFLDSTGTCISRVGVGLSLSDWTPNLRREFRPVGQTNPERLIAGMPHRLILFKKTPRSWAADAA
jgi:hypothetical protein